MGSLVFEKDLNLIIITILSSIIWLFSQSESDNGKIDYFPRSEWRQLRRQVLQRDYYKCNHCKKSFSHNIAKLHIHHIIERFQWGKDTPDNLICLCEACHGKLHKDSEKPMHANAKKKIIESTITNNGILHFDYRAESLGGIGTNSTRKVKPERFYSQNGHYYMYWFCYLDNDFRYFRVSRIVKFHQE